MATIEQDALVFRFDGYGADAAFRIDLQRTLRIPDSDETYPLPPGFGPFPLRPVGGAGEAIAPVWQSEALWLHFGGETNAPPVAIRVEAGGIDAITGEASRKGLHRDPQDYLVWPEQPWLDGFAIGGGVVRQFVAMPLGEGYTAEEQLTGTAEQGGLQIAVTPLRLSVWEPLRRRLASFDWMEMEQERSVAGAMGLGAGGRMRQVIATDPHDAGDWDTALTQRATVALLDAEGWADLTGEAPPSVPPTAQDYARAGLPWFDLYGTDQVARGGSAALKGLTSVGGMTKEKTGEALPGSEDVETGPPVMLGKKG